MKMPKVCIGDSFRDPNFAVIKQRNDLVWLEVYAWEGDCSSMRGETPCDTFNEAMDLAVNWYNNGPGYLG